MANKSGKRSKRPAGLGSPGSLKGKARKALEVSSEVEQAPLNGDSSADSPLTPADDQDAPAKPARKKRKSDLTVPSSAHGMRTRSKARIFPFLRLPPEIRSYIYHFAFGTETPVPLEDLQLPEAIKVPQILSEALPVLLENTPITASVMSNWCVRYQHRHVAGFRRYDEAGQVDVPEMLGDGSLAQQIARFKQLHFSARCCCCDHGKAVAKLDVTVTQEERKFSTSTEAEVVNRNNVYQKVVVGLDKMLGVAKAEVQRISSRHNFNGFTVEDVERVAKCFCDDEDSDGESHDE